MLTIRECSLGADIVIFSVMNKLYYRHLRGREKTDWRTPSARPPADIEIAVVYRFYTSCIHGIIEPGDDAEGKNLSLVGMPRELKVEEAERILFHKRPVLQEEGEGVAREP